MHEVSHILTSIYPSICTIRDAASRGAFSHTCGSYKYKPYTLTHSRSLCIAGITRQLLLQKLGYSSTYSEHVREYTRISENIREKRAHWGCKYTSKREETHRRHTSAANCIHDEFLSLPLSLSLCDRFTLSLTTYVMHTSIVICVHCMFVYVTSRRIRRFRHCRMPTDITQLVYESQTI